MSRFIETLKIVLVIVVSVFIVYIGYTLSEGQENEKITENNYKIFVEDTVNKKLGVKDSDVLNEVCDKECNVYAGGSIYKVYVSEEDKDRLYIVKKGKVE